MKRWYYDTEFTDDGFTIDLISIAFVSDAGEEYYAVSNEFVRDRCNDWVKVNVLPKLPPRELWKPRQLIADELRGLLLGVDLGNPNPIELWAYYAAYDHVAFCQLFGPMIDLPAGMPMYTHDLKQRMDDRGVTKHQLPKQDESSLHSALADARWVRRTEMLLRGHR